MMIAVTTATVVLTLIIASERSLQRALDTHEALNASADAATLFAQQAATFDYEMVAQAENAVRFPYAETQCVEWQLVNDRLLYRTWTQGATPPAQFSELIPGGVTGFDVVAEGPVMTMALQMKPNDTTPTVRTNRNMVSTFVAPEPTIPERTDPCV